jgi:hypothetical protein
MPTALRSIRYQGQSGKHLLFAFGPRADISVRQISLSLFFIAPTCEALSVIDDIFWKAVSAIT